MSDQGRTAAAADRLLGIQGHETFSYGQSLTLESAAARAVAIHLPPVGAPRWWRGWLTWAPI